MKRFLSLALCLLTILNFSMICLPQTVLAADTGIEEETPVREPNKWYGDTMAIPVLANNNGYTFRSVYVAPHHAYEMSNHMVSNNGGAANDIPQTLILVEANKDYTWTPNGLFSPATSNYRVLYCCDAETGYDNSVYYKRLNLEDSSYYDQNAAEHIRSIVFYSYPYVDLEVMKTRLEADGFPNADKLTRAEIISAVQSAIWAYANTETGLYTYSQTFDVPTNSQWGGVVHDYTNEMDVWWTTGKRKFSTSEEVKERVNSLTDFLINLEGTTAGRDSILITGMQITDCVPVIEKDGVYTVALMLSLNTSGNTGDSVDIQISVDNIPVDTCSVIPGVDYYNFTVQAGAGQIIKAVVSGTQYIASGVYFYEAEGGRDISQSLVDVASGETEIYCETAVQLFEIPESPKANINLYKTDDAGNALAGAAFTLYAIGQTGYVHVGTYPADSNGVVALTDIIPGAYAIVETVAPDGFHLLGGEILFGVTEEGKVEPISLPDGVTVTDEGDTYSVSVVNIPEYTSVSGEKTWDDEDNYDGLRPDSITINLLADGKAIETKTVTAANGWKWEFTDLPTMVDGKRVKYTISENPVPAYETIIDGYDVTNKHVPEKIEISGQKTWNDDNNRDGLRPESITVNLLADGKIVASKTVTAADGWKWSFTDLYKYNHGAEIVYTISEVPVFSYVTEIDGFDIINMYVPQYTNIAGSKTWNDDNNRDGMRPESITIYLLADGVIIDSDTVTAADGWAWNFTDLPLYRNGNTKIEYTIEEKAVDNYISEIDGFNVINTYVPEKTSIGVVKVWQDADNKDGVRPDQVTVKLLANGVDTGKTVVLRKENGWMATFGDLDAYQNGTPIAYTVEEIVPAGYTAVVEASGTSGYTITNVRTPEKIDIPVVKVWNDDNNRDGLRPSSILVRLLADGADTGIVATVSAANGWRATFTDLDAYRNGAKINYTVEEVDSVGYIAFVTGDSNSGFVITNTREAKKIDLSGRKLWNDNNNVSGKRPESITINLLANDVIVESKVVTAADGWAWTFKDLAVYQNGSRIVYSITENAVPGYETTYQGFNVINTPVEEPVYMDIPVAKIWDDFDDAFEARPEFIAVDLLANGVDSGKTIILSDDNNWAASFVGLPATDENGDAIYYSVRERAVESYVSAVTGDAEVGFTITNTYTEEFEEDPVPLSSPPTGDSTIKLVVTLAFAAAACIVALKLKKKHN